MARPDSRYPSKALESEWQKQGLRYTVGWQMRGPKGTGVAWMVGYGLNGRVVIVQTFVDGGWEAYTAPNTIRADETIADVARRCGLEG